MPPDLGAPLSPEQPQTVRIPWIKKIRKTLVNVISTFRDSGGVLALPFVIVIQRFERLLREDIDDFSDEISLAGWNAECAKIEKAFRLCHMIIHTNCSWNPDMHKQINQKFAQLATTFINFTLVAFQSSKKNDRKQNTIRVYNLLKSMYLSESWADGTLGLMNLFLASSLCTWPCDSTDHKNFAYYFIKQILVDGPSYFFNAESYVKFLTLAKVFEVNFSFTKEIVKTCLSNQPPKKRKEFYKLTTELVHESLPRNPRHITSTLLFDVIIPGEIFKSATGSMRSKLGMNLTQKKECKDYLKRIAKRSTSSSVPEPACECAINLKSPSMPIAIVSPRRNVVRNEDEDDESMFGGSGHAETIDEIMTNTDDFDLETEGTDEETIDNYVEYSENSSPSVIEDEGEDDVISIKEEEVDEALDMQEITMDGYETSIDEILKVETEEVGSANNQSGDENLEDVVKSEEEMETMQVIPLPAVFVEVPAFGSTDSEAVAKNEKKYMEKLAIESEEESRLKKMTSESEGEMKPHQLENKIEEISPQSLPTSAMVYIESKQDIHDKTKEGEISISSSEDMFEDDSDTIIVYVPFMKEVQVQLSRLEDNEYNFSKIGGKLIETVVERSSPQISTRVKGLEKGNSTQELIASKNIDKRSIIEKDSKMCSETSNGTSSVKPKYINVRETSEIVDAPAKRTRLALKKSETPNIIMIGKIIRKSPKSSSPFD